MILEGIWYSDISARQARPVCGAAVHIMMSACLHKLARRPPYQPDYGWLEVLGGHAVMPRPWPYSRYWPRVTPLPHPASPQCPPHCRSTWYAGRPWLNRYLAVDRCSGGGCGCRVGITELHIGNIMFALSVFHTPSGLLRASTVCSLSLSRWYI